MIACSKTVYLEVPKKGFQHVGSNQTHFEAALGQNNTVGPAKLILIRKVRFDKERMHFVNIGVISARSVLKPMQHCKYTLVAHIHLYNYATSQGMTQACHDNSV